MAISVDGSQRTVLVIEDDATIQELLADLLTMEDYRVVQARDGETGIALAGRVSPDVVLLDINIPPSSGFEILGRLRRDETTANIPIVVVSGHAVPIWPTDGLAPDAFIAKPFDLDDVLTHVERLLDGGPAPAAG